jgi:hypothetical protein
MSSRFLLALAAAASLAAAIWLFTVSVTVLPSRDPAHLAMWRGVATVLVLYAVISLLRFSSRGARLGPVLTWGGSLFVGAGAWLMIGAFAARHFEGYLVLLGAIMIAHGLAAIAHVAASRRSITESP